MTAICDSCGKEYSVGEWPFCPHGQPSYYFAHFTPYVDENIVSEDHKYYDKNLGGVLISSERQREQIMKEEGLELGAHRKVGMPGCVI